MTAIFMVVHVLLAIALVIVVLLQRSDGGALGGLGGGGTFGGIMSGRQSANLLTRSTAIIAAAFMGTSLILAILASGRSEPTSILDAPAPAASESPLPAPDDGDTGPSAPVAR